MPRVIVPHPMRWMRALPRPRRTFVALATLLIVAGLPVGPVPTATAADPPVPFEEPRFLGDTEAEASIQAAGVPPSGFQDQIVYSGLVNPVGVRFTSDGRVFVAEKRGRILAYDSVADTTPTVFVDLGPKVHDFWDRGLLGMTVSPNFATDPYVYALYALDAAIGASPPRWNDGCPTPPGPTSDGCLIGARLSRFSASGGTAGSEQILIEDWCQQYPSHSIGDVRFGADGALYLTGGDGASFTFTDYGQDGSPVNPCGDPPGGVGGGMSPPSARGGALRSQSVRRPAGEPVTLDGAILRVNPATGAAMSGNPLIGHANANARRMVGFGTRNPFRFTFRPGTSEIWLGDVGYNNWEEINRIVNPLSSTVANLGWPCYEGSGRLTPYESAGLQLCSSLYATPTGLLAPYFSYNHAANIVSGEPCSTGSSAIAGLAFYTTGNYPATYQNALFFADHSRNCIWAMKAGGNGLPNTSNIEVFVSGAINPVSLEIGPGGDLFYVNFEGGEIRRIVRTGANGAPTAVIAANPTSGPAPLQVAFDGTSSSDPDGEPLLYAWDLDGDGQYDDSTSPTPSFTYSSPANVTVRLRVTDTRGGTGTTTQTIIVNDPSLQAVIDTPSSSVTWAVGEQISFTGHASDASGPLPASALSWTLIINHCPSNCHPHTVQSWPGVASGSFAAPDHDYPSTLELRLTATSGTQQTSTSVNLNPKTVNLSFASVPTGASLTVGNYPTRTTPFQQTVIQGSINTLSAPVTQVIGSTNHQFQSWSDGGTATHNITAPTTPTTYTATYTATAGTTSFLSDLPYTVTANGWGPVEKDRSNGEAGSGDGLPLTLNGTVYPKGLGGHAASDIRYNLAGNCSTFSVSVGLDDEVGNNGSLIFTILADGVQLWTSGVMTGASATQTTSQSVAGRTQLQLVLGTNGTPDYDHGDWADAKVTCGGGPPPDTTPPTVTAITPADGATGQAVTISPTATFSEAMTAATITTTTVTIVRQGTTTNLAAAVTYDPATLRATINPTADLLASTAYVVTVKGGAAGVKDAAGNALAVDRTWTFTTAATPDTTPPTVTAITPADGATGQAVTISPTATFSEAMTAATITTTTVTIVRQGTTTNLAAAVTYDPATLRATINPTADLLASTAYVVTVKGGAAGVKDAAGNALAVDRTWTFTTAAGGGGTTSFLSDLPYTVTANGWGPVEKDRSNGEAGSGDGLPLTLNGTVYPKGLGGHAASDIRYNLAGNCSTFSVSVGLDDEVGNNGSLIFTILADGVQLWTSGVMTGASATQTTSQSVAGRTQLQLVLGTNGTPDYDHGDWADAKVTCGGGPPPDTTPPTVTAITPADGATGQAVTISPTATFSEAMTAATITTTTVTIVRQGTTTNLAAAVTYDPATLRATINPTADLLASTAYVVTVKGGAAGVKDAAGNALAVDRTWTFTTAATPDTTPPTVTAITPADGATGQAVTISPTATFSEAMTAATITTTTVTIVRQGTTTNLAAAVTYDPATLRATINPTADLLASTAYVVTVKGGAAGVKDAAGNALAVDRTWTFTTAATPDTTPPTVTAITPADGATGQAVTISPTATFSEAMTASTITTTTVTIVRQGTTTNLAAAVTYDPATLRATINPTADLLASTAYVVTVKGGAAGVKDAAGNALAVDRTWTFTTAAGGGGTTSFLSDLPYTVTANGWGPVEKDRSNGEADINDGGPLTLNGTVYPKGLGGHAASDIRYNLAGNCSTFSVSVGLDDEVGNNGSLIFTILADGVQLWTSGVMTGASATQTTSQSVAGRTQLQLVLGTNGTPDYDHGDWADAKVTCG